MKKYIKRLIFMVGLIGCLLLVFLLFLFYQTHNLSNKREKQDTNISEIVSTKSEKGICTPVPEEIAPDISTTQEPQKEEEDTLQEKSNGYLVVIDPGHQKKSNTDLEPIGPGATEKKAKVTGGTSGIVTGIKEYQLNLQVARKLEKKLKKAGYEVIMVRRTNDVNISNRERAQIANDAKADAFIRIHADGSENKSAVGAMTICSTENNPYCSQIYKKSKQLSKKVIKNVSESCGCVSRGVWETDSMSGINWCEVPVTILEMGFMTNPEEDQLMASSQYQNKIAQGILEGINEFLGVN